MNKRSFNQGIVLRFKRWSRKKFGAFCSLGKCVIISHVKNSIANASLSKQIGSYSENACFFTDTTQLSLSSMPTDIPLDNLPEEILTYIVEKDNSDIPSCRNLIYTGRHLIAYTSVWQLGVFFCLY
ncbi:MAG: hypothetical protein Q4F97_00010 [Bacteroidales bacterium]|nr:hypothetical protein [Bacteroidales bacterium]